MKPVRVLLISLGIFATVIAAAVILVLTPSFQRWAVLRAARDLPGLNLELASVSAGLSGVTLTGVKARPEGIPVTLDRLEADFLPLALVLGGELDLRRLRLTGLHVDASRMSRGRAEAAAAGAPAAAPGLLANVILPFDLRLGEVSIEGRALLPGAPGQPPHEAAYTITGGRLAPGQEGSLRLEATLRNPADGAKVSALRIQADLKATLTPARTFGKVSLATLAEAEGSALAGPSQLKVGAELYHTTVGENYEVAVSTLMQNRTENLLIVRAELPAGTRRYAGEWALKARTAQLEPFILTGALPDFEVDGDGRFVLDAATGNVSTEGGLRARVSRLEAVEPAWRPFGQLNIEADFDASQQDGVLDLRRFKAQVDGTGPVMHVRTTAPLRYDLRKGELLSGAAVTDALLHVDLQGLPLEWVRPFITPADISGGAVTGQVDLARSASDAARLQVRAQLRLDELNVVQQGRPLLTKAAVSARVEAGLAGGAIEAPLVELVVRTPAGDAFELGGRVSTQPGPGAPVTAAIRFTATTPRLLERWLPGGPVSAQGEIDATLHGDAVEVRPGRITVTQGPGRPLLESVLAQPFTLNLATHAIAARDPAQAVASLRVGRVPLSLLPLAQPGAVIGGHLQEGEFEVRAPDGRLLLRAVQPLQLADVSLTQGRQPALRDLSVRAQPVVEYAGPGHLKFQSGDVVVQTAAAPFLSLRLDATQSPGQDTQAVMNFTLEVPALATQPLFAGAQAVNAGRASGELRAAVGEHSQLEARVTVNGLTAPGIERTLPVANVGFRARMQASGAVSIEVPLLLDNAGNRSDLKFALELTPLGRGYSVDGSLTGQQVELEDLLGVLGVFSATAAPDSADRPAPAAAVTADPVSAWSRFSGRLGLDIKAVTRGKDWAMTGLTGTVAVEPSLITLQRLEAAFSETSRLAAKMELRFTGGAMPYRLTGDYALNEFDTGRLFRAMEPDRAPTVEGLFTITGRLAGNGETPARAIERVQGDFQLTSRQGMFRGLQRTTSRVSMTSKAVELGASVLGSIFGSDKVTRTAEKVAGQAYFVDQLAQSLGEFSYDLLSVRLTRDELLNMSLQDFSLVSPEIRLHGRGSVSYEVGRPLLEQPLSVSLQIAARGKVEQLLGRLRLLDTAKDELGYTKARETITVGGTLARPDPSAFFTKMATARIADFLDGEN